MVIGEAAVRGAQLLEGDQADTVAEAASLEGERAAKGNRYRGGTLEATNTNIIYINSPAAGDTAP